MANVGYARVSKGEQNPDAQVDALKAAGCERVFVDYASGKLSSRPQLAAALDYVRSGDTLTVTRLSRLGRSLKHLIDLAGQLADAGVAFRSLHEAIDTTTPAGRLTYHLFGALAEFQRELIVDQTREGIAAARARGRVGGRRRKMTAEKVRVAQEMYDSHDYRIAQIAETVGVSPRTLYSYLATDKQQKGSP